MESRLYSCHSPSNCWDRRHCPAQTETWVGDTEWMCVCVCFTGFSHSLASDLPLKGTRCVSLKIGHVRHHKCLKLTKIASHMSKVSVPLQFVWTGSSSCPVCLWGSDVFPSLPTALTVFHLFGHSEGLEINPPPPPPQKNLKKITNTGHPRLKTQAGGWPLEKTWRVSSWCQQRRKCGGKSRFRSELFIVAASINILQAHWKKLMTLNITLMIYIPDGDVPEKVEIVPCVISACRCRHAAT